jgi:hypothetical protein
MDNIITLCKEHNILINIISNNSSTEIIISLLNYNYNSERFKIDKYYNLFYNIIIYINNNNINNINDIIFKSNILYYFTIISKGHILLTHIESKINIIPNENILKFILLASKYSNIYVLLFWIKLSTYNNFEQLPINNKKEIFLNSINNPDDRLFIYLLQNYLIILNENNTLIISIIQNICNLRNNKYLLQKLKILNTYIDLNLYIEYVISHIHNVNILYKINKYYNITYNFKILNIILNKYNNINNDDIQNIFKLLLNNDNDYYIILNILCYLKYSNIDIIDSNINNNIKNQIIENYELLLNIFFKRYEFLINNYTKYKISNTFLKICKEYNLIHIFTNERAIYLTCYPVNILLYTRFNRNFNNILSQREICIKVNFLLHYLRMYIKYKQNINKYNFELRMNIVLNELNKLNYKKINNKEFFNNLILLKNKKNIKLTNCLIYKSIKNISINNIPSNIYPYTNIFNEYSVKAEYIIEQDLYLIIDINIPNTTFIERYNILHKIHNNTNYININKINNIDEFDNLYKEYNINMNKFLINNKNKIIKWIPKFICYINNNKNINTDEYIIIYLN